MKRILAATALLVAAIPLSAQKKPLDHDVYDSWQHIASPMLSAAGNVVSYQVDPLEGDGTLYIRTLGKKGREFSIERGYKAVISENEHFVVCLVKPPFSDTRKAKIEKKKKEQMPADSLAVLDLRDGSVRKFPKVMSFKTPKYPGNVIAIASRDTAIIDKADRKKTDIGSPLLVLDMESGKADTLKGIDKYVFDENGRQLAFTKVTGNKRSVAGFYDIASGSSRCLTDTSTFISLPTFDKAGTRALYLTSSDTLKSGSKHCVLHHYDVSEGSDKILRIDGFPEGQGLTENSRCFFSRNGEKIYASVQEFRAPDDTTLVSFETPSLDIWNWDADELPPMSKKTLDRDLKRSSTGLLKDGRLFLPGESKFTRMQASARYDGDIFLLETVVNPVETQWNMQNDVRLSIADAADGSVRTVAEGVFDSPRLSPYGKYVIWWDLDSSSWRKYDVAQGSASALIPTGDPGVWADEEDDHPMKKESYGIAEWVGDDEAVLLYDRYDIWKVSLRDGKAARLTKGREECRTYRYLKVTEDDEVLSLPSDAVITMSVFDNVSKENGIATLRLNAPEKSFAVKAFGRWSFRSVSKARKGDTYIYQKGNFNVQPDIYATSDFGRKDMKLSSINPQMADYNWGTAELYHWKAFDGTPLDGILYKPEDFDPAKKYPVMIYFYEKNSESLYESFQPAPSASIINRPLYVSQGYVVFIPDIVYTPGLPGESAYNCIVSGAESLTRFPWIDADNMAIQGQSWGGYQVAWLVTRTGMFKAAGAGAPVANMTSAYGGIRWASGMSRQFQYEQTQSRIGRSLWDGIELYMENSPIFKLPNVTTPLLIMHNDNDGAVPWYQGIELFMGLRRLGKPCWLLEYNGEEHNLMERRNRKDLSIRMLQFFDHYLKGAPAPAWMKDGIPTSRKGQYFGYETE